MTSGKKTKSNVTVVQEGTSSYHIIIPKQIADSLGLTPGEPMEWQIRSRDELRLFRLKKP
jgi:bifunctional DNA-binding transcriptional regulator/antitoxin component of YhaV-PrlF toxin-antitoxin module